MNEFWTVKVTWADGFSATRRVKALYLIGGAIMDLTAHFFGQHGDVLSVEAA